MSKRQENAEFHFTTIKRDTITPVSKITFMSARQNEHEFACITQSHLGPISYNIHSKKKKKS